MAEETTTTTEGENLNWENGDNTPKSYSEQEVAEMIEAEKKKLQSDTEKGVQKLIKANKLLEEWYKALDKNADDTTYLIWLADENPELAKLVLDKFYWWRTLEEYMDYIGYQEDLTDPKVLQKKAEKLAEKKLIEKERMKQSETIEKETQSFIDKLKMTDWEKGKFLEALEERKELKSFNLENLEKHFEKAYREISDKPLLKTQEVIAKTQAIWEQRSDWLGKSKTDLDKSREDARDFLKAMWL